MSAHRLQGAGLPVFQGYQGQYGRGLGNVLAGVLRSAVPLIAPAVKGLSRSLIRAGANKLQRVIDDRLTTTSRPRRIKRRATTSRHSVSRKRRRKADILS